MRRANDTRNRSPQSFSPIQTALECAATPAQRVALQASRIDHRLRHRPFEFCVARHLALGNSQLGVDLSNLRLTGTALQAVDHRLQPSQHFSLANDLTKNRQ